QAELDATPAVARILAIVIGLKGRFAGIGFRSQAQTKSGIGRRLAKFSQQLLRLIHHLIDFPVDGRRIPGIGGKAIVDPQKENHKIRDPPVRTFAEVSFNIQYGLSILPCKYKRAAPVFASSRLLILKRIKTLPSPATVTFMRHTGSR